MAEQSLEEKIKKVQELTSIIKIELCMDMILGRLESNKYTHRTELFEGVTGFDDIYNIPIQLALGLLIRNGVVFSIRHEKPESLLGFEHYLILTGLHKTGDRYYAQPLRIKYSGPGYVYD